MKKEDYKDLCKKWANIIRSVNKVFNETDRKIDEDLVDRKDEIIDEINDLVGEIRADE